MSTQARSAVSASQTAASATRLKATASATTIGATFGNFRWSLALQAKLPAVQGLAAPDPRLPADQAEALRLAVDSKRAIDAANARLASAAVELKSRNVPAFVAQQGLRLAALTPRHDSAATPGSIFFFAGETSYADSLELPAHTTHHVDVANRSVRIRVRSHGDVGALLTELEIEERLVQAVSEIAHISAARLRAPEQFDLYRARFNALWDVEPFASLSTSFDANLNSKGARTPKARQIFERIYEDDLVLRDAYDANRGGIRERIDTYFAPESFNPLNSPRLQKLREVFFRERMPISRAAFPRFRAALVLVAMGLDQADRDAVDRSADWQRLINAHLTTDAERAELHMIIRTPPQVSAAPTAVAPAPAPAPAGPRPVVTPQTKFVDGVTIEGPAAPVVANGRRAQIVLTPRSTVPNPGVAIDTRFIVTPANRVHDSNVSPLSQWASGVDAGVPFSPEIINNSSTGTMTAHLELLNGPPGLAPWAPTPDLHFTVQDNRLAHFVATWYAGVIFSGGMRRDWFDPLTSEPRYYGGVQNFEVVGFLPSGATNPGLTLFIKARIMRGATVVAAPATLEPFPPDVSSTTAIAIDLLAPDTMPAGVDPLTFEVDLLAADLTVLNSQTIKMDVLEERTYTKAQAIAEATADEAYLNDTSPGGLLGKMTAMGGEEAMAAAAIGATDQPKITLKPVTQRHDSRRYVTAVSGRARADLRGYFVGTTYGDTPPDVAHSFASFAGAAAFFLPAEFGFGQRFIVANVTTDVGAVPPAKRTDDDLIPYITHEAVHAMDFVGNLVRHRYRHEFDAYWMEGRFGPPHQATCPRSSTPLTTPCAPTGCQDTAYRPDLSPPGPRSCRARAIFDHIYGSTVYPWMKPAYDNNTDGFGWFVDNYIIPDGINLIVSRRLELLRALIEGFSGRGFDAFRISLLGFVGIGVPPSVGVLTADELHEVKSNRAWRDLVERKIPKAQWARIKDDLGIPR